MKRLCTVIVACLFATTALYAQQHDLSISYTNYTEGQYVGYGNIQTEFKITNVGPTDLHVGDTILLAAKFNNKVYDMYLKKQDSVTVWKLTADLPVGGTLILNPGYLVGWQWASNANFKVADGTLTLTLMVYGVGLASWHNNYADDPNPADNKATIIYKNVDLSVKFDNYVNKEVTYKTKISPKFTITNNGPVAIKSGETIYLRASINGALYSMSLVANDTTKYVLTSDLAVGGTVTLDPGYIDAAQTAMLLGKDTVQIGVLVYGVSKSSVHASFRTDGKPADNKVTVTYNPAVKEDLAIKFTQYTERQYIGYGNIQTEFTVTNNGPTTLHAGDTLMLAAKFNNTVYDMYLKKVDSVTLWKLTQDIPVGGTLTLNPGYLEGHSWQYWLPKNFPGMPTDLFKLTLIVYGKGLASWKPDFSTDANPADNETTITYKNIDLAISFDDYTSYEVTTNSTIQTAFTITNNGPVALKAGETIYLQASLNGDLYSLSLAPGDTTAYTLTSDLNIGGSLELNLGTIDAIQTSQLLGTDTLQLGVVLHGLKQSPWITATKFATDGDSTNNITYVTYKESLTTGVTNKKNSSVVNVYPNPAVDDINFQFTSTDVQKIVIVDATGRLVKQVTVANTLETVDVSDMISGIYYYSILSSKGVAASDILIVR